MENLLELLFFIIFLAGIIILQIFLSKRDNKWLGLILPVISIMFSVMGVLGLAVYENQSTVATIFQLIMVFLLSNIPTIILLAVYFGCREKFKNNRELDKMNIEDLE
jgi:predicted permease